MVLIGIGANLPGPDGAPPIEMCLRAVVALDTLAGLRLRGLSRWYATAPIPVSSQPPYINGVAHLVGDVEPAALLAALQAMEARAGRIRGDRNAARVLDLDIIAMGKGGQMVRSAPDPVLPHPRAHERAFVLVPLREVAPGWVHPILRRDVEALIDALPAQQISAL